MKRLVTILPLMVTMYVSSAYGYQYISADCGNINFNSGHMTFNLTTSLTSDEKTAIELGTDRATLYSDSSITYNDNGDNSWGTANGQNEVFRDLTHSTAYCNYRYNTVSCNVVEADIAFGDEPWVTTDAYNTFHFNVDGRSVTGTAVHEGGHCVGMGHENRYYNMMGADFEHLTWSGGSAFYGPGEDMSAGLINLHGKRSTTDTYRDVGVTVMRYSYADGAYSRHVSGVLRNTSGTQLPVVGSYADQALFRVDGGQQIRIELTLENNGEQNSETPSLGFYLSTNDIISTADTNVGNVIGLTLGRALPLETYYTITIPSSTVAGDYFLGAFIDDDDAIIEYSLSPNLNNTTFYPIRVYGADLVVSAFSRTPSSLLPSGTLSMSATVSNQGTAGSASTTLRYYRSTNSFISTYDTQVCTDGVSSLSTGGTSTESCSVSVPSTPGTYYYGACVDSVTGETSTSNQCSSGYAVTVGRPDLIISSFSRTPSSLYLGGTLNMSASVKNQGTILSASTTLRYYRSTDSIISTGDTQVCTDGVSSLSPNGTSTESCRVTASMPGDYYYGVCVDSVSGETATSNNCSTGILVQVSDASASCSGVDVTIANRVHTEIGLICEGTNSITVGPNVRVEIPGSVTYRSPSMSFSEFFVETGATFKAVNIP